MNKDQAKEILNILYISYPNFNHRNARGFNEYWINQLVAADYSKTKRKTEHYTVNNTFPPALADIVVIEPKPDVDPMKSQKEKDRQRIAEENADPEKRKRREQSLAEMQKAIESI